MQKCRKIRIRIPPCAQLARVVIVDIDREGCRPWDESDSGLRDRRFPVVLSPFVSKVKGLPEVLPSSNPE